MSQVSDGDTIRVENLSNSVRFACIDAPESNQPYGSQSTSFLRDIISKNNDMVQMEIVDTDIFGRSIAGIWIDSTFVQLVLLEQGLAWVYEEYIDNCPFSHNRLRAAQRAAQRRRLGLWSDESPTPPWEWRRR